MNKVNQRQILTKPFMLHQEKALDDNGNQVAENVSFVLLAPVESEPKQQVYEADSTQEYFMRAEDGKVVEEVSTYMIHNSLESLINLCDTNSIKIELNFINHMS